VIVRGIVPTEEAALVEFFRGMRGTVHVVFEEGTQAQWLYELLAPLVDRVVVCDVRGQARHGNKGDRIDADQLSECLRRGGLRVVYHGSGRRAALKELTSTYRNLVEDATRVMLRLKALFRARAIPTPGTKVYQAGERAQWLERLGEAGARYRGEVLCAELDVLRELRPKAKAAMVAEARRDAAWPVLSAIPFLGPVRVAQLLATLQTPWRFRTKRNLWAYCGLAVVTRSSDDYALGDGRHGAARAAAGLLSRPDRPRDARGVGPRDAHPQARGAHAAALENRRTLRSDQADDASALAPGAPRQRCGSGPLAAALRIRDQGARGSLEQVVHPAGSPAEVLA